MKHRVLAVSLSALAAVVGAPTVASATTNVVVTFDSETMEAGVAGASAPTVVVPTLAGTVRTGPTATSTTAVYGDAAASRRGVIATTHPVRRGEVVDWTAFRGLVNYVITTKLGLVPTDVALLIASAKPADDQRPFQDMAFAFLHVPRAYFTSEPVLALYASGRTTGLVLELDADESGAYAVYEGYSKAQWSRYGDYGQTEVLSSLSSMLAAKGITVSLTNQRSWLQGLLDQDGYVAASYAVEMQKTPSTIAKSYAFPNGTSVTVDRERFRAPELLFQPTTFGVPSTQPPVHQMAYDVIMTSDVGLRESLAANVVVAGTNSMVPGLSTRVSSELTALFRRRRRVTSSRPRTASTPRG